MVEQGEIQRTQNEVTQDMRTEEEENPHKGAGGQEDTTKHSTNLGLNTTSGEVTEHAKLPPFSSRGKAQGRT